MLWRSTKSSMSLSKKGEEMLAAAEPEDVPQAPGITAQRDHIINAMIFSKSCCQGEGSSPPPLSLALTPE